MDSEQKNLKGHLFICTHEREDRASCGALKSDELVKELKDWVKKEGLKQDIKVTRSGCLGLCDEGIAAVCYPQGRWYTQLNPKDADRLKHELQSR